MNYSIEDALLREAFTNILNYCDIYFTYITFYMANLLNEISSGNAFNRDNFGIGGALKFDNDKKSSVLVISADSWFLNPERRICISSAVLF